MKPKEFISKTISMKSGNLEATRTRTSEGYAAITIRQIPTSPGAICTQIVFEGETYFQDALEAIGMLQRIVDNPCELPK